MSAPTTSFDNVVALAGGVGGARLVHGLRGALPPGALSVVVNTGDDFDHWGLRVCPDLDTVMYTLSGDADMKRGWGLGDESFRCLERVKQLGGADWFMLGDRDLATHIMRTQWLREGASLREVTSRLCGALGVTTELLPAAAGRRTMVDTDEHGTLDFQSWLVGHRGAPTVRAVRFEGQTTPEAGVIEALSTADLVVLCPSNPYVSIDPILTLEGVRDALRGKTVVGLSPIVGGRAVKGPLAEMLPALSGRPASAASVAAHYDGLLSGFVVEAGDAVPGLPTHGTSTIMGDETDRVRLAAEVLGFAEELG